MDGKITEYGNETNEVGVLDLLDISKKIDGGSYESRRFKRDDTTKELIFSGGLTIFKGENSSDTKSALIARNLSNEDIIVARNDRRVAIGHSTPSATFHVRGVTGFASIFQGIDSSPSQYTMQLKDGFNILHHQFRNNGRADIGLVGNVHVGGSSGKPEKLYVTGDLNVSGAYKSGGSTGVASFTGAVTSITITNGLVTAIS